MRSIDARDAIEVVESPRRRFEGQTPEALGCSKAFPIPR
jgi:hypothetical protein